MIWGPFGLLAVGSATIASFPAFVFGAEVLLSFLPNRRSPSTPLSAPRMTVIVPAHNEATGIQASVAHLKAELGPRDELVVVADNCTDDTAVLAREQGATVLERTDAIRRGKGFALTFARDWLSANPPDVVIVMDADCVVAEGSLRGLAEKSVRLGLPLQAVYLMNRPPAGGAKAGVSAFAFFVRNLIRPRGLARVSVPCLLTGTGMAFPWAAYRDAPATENFLAEDLLLGHELALRGTPPFLDESTVVLSELPTGDAASFRQRRRWEHGQLSVLRAVVPRLLRAGLLERRPSLLALAADGLVPPLALLVVLEGLTLVAASLLGLLTNFWAPTLIASIGFALLCVGVLLSWVCGGRRYLSSEELLEIPRYILWKLPLYSSFARKGAHREWERTDRA